MKKLQLLFFIVFASLFLVSANAEKSAHEVIPGKAALQFTLAKDFKPYTGTQLLVFFNDRYIGSLSAFIKVNTTSVISVDEKPFYVVQTKNPIFSAGTLELPLEGVGKGTLRVALYDDWRVISTDESAEFERDLAEIRASIAEAKVAEVGKRYDFPVKAFQPRFAVFLLYSEEIDIAPGDSVERTFAVKGARMGVMGKQYFVAQ